MDWQYTTATVTAPFDEIDSEVEHKFNHLQDAGYEYVNGPAVALRGDTPSYTFMVRRRRPQPSAYEDHDLITV